MVDVPIVDRDYKPDYSVDSEIYIYIVTYWLWYDIEIIVRFTTIVS